MGTDIVAAGKPLNVTQTKNLQAIVEGDHTDLRGQVYASIQRQLGDRLKEIAAEEAAINEKYRDDSDLDQAKLELVAFARKLEDQSNAFFAKLKKNGGIGVPQSDKPLRDNATALNIIANPSTLAKLGKQAELDVIKAKRTAVQEASNRVQNTAYSIIGRSQRDQNRAILLSTIELNSQDLLAGIPDANKIFAAVESEVNALNKDDLELLGGKDQLSLTA